jgi:hypothetical protein
MPFVKTGIATVGVVKCSCGMTLESVFTKCPKCKKNLRPFSDPKSEKSAETTASDEDTPPVHNC